MPTGDPNDTKSWADWIGEAKPGECIFLPPGVPPRDPLAFQSLRPHPLLCGLNIEQFNTLFHRLWSGCVGQEWYEKKAWMNIQQQLDHLGIPV